MSSEGHAASVRKASPTFRSTLSLAHAEDVWVASPNRIRAAPPQSPQQASRDATSSPYIAHHDRPHVLSFNTAVDASPSGGRRHFNSPMATNTSQHFANGSLAASPPQYPARKTPGTPKASPQQATRDMLPPKPHLASSGVTKLMSSPPDHRVRSKVSHERSPQASPNLTTRETKPIVPHLTSSGVAGAMADLPPSPPKQRPSSRGLVHVSPHTASSGVTSALAGRTDSPTRFRPGRAQSPRSPVSHTAGAGTSGVDLAKLDRCTSPERRAVGAGMRKGRAQETPRSPPPFGTEADLKSWRPDRSGQTPGASPVRGLIAAYEARTMQCRGGPSPRHNVPTLTQASAEQRSPKRHAHMASKPSMANSSPLHSSPKEMKASTPQSKSKPFYGGA